MYSTNAEMKEFHSFVNSTVRECVTVGGSNPSYESMSSTNMTEISTEGLISWVKDKLKKIFTKFVVIVNKIAARFSKNRQQLLKNIEIYKKNPKAKVKLPVSPKTIKRVTVTLAAVAAATAAILVCKNRNGGKKKIQELHERADEQLNAVNKEVGEEKKEGVEVSAQEAANASQELANSIEKSENTLKQSANKASHTTPQGKTPEEVKAETQTTGAGVNAASDLNHKASILARNAAAKDARVKAQRLQELKDDKYNKRDQERYDRRTAEKKEGDAAKAKLPEVKNQYEKAKKEVEEYEAYMEKNKPKNKIELLKNKKKYQAMADKYNSLIDEQNRLSKEVSHTSIAASKGNTDPGKNPAEKLDKDADDYAQFDRRARKAKVERFLKGKEEKKEREAQKKKDEENKKARRKQAEEESRKEQKQRFLSSLHQDEDYSHITKLIEKIISSDDKTLFLDYYPKLKKEALNDSKAKTILETISGAKKTAKQKYTEYMNYVNTTNDIIHEGRVVDNLHTIFRTASNTIDDAREPLREKYRK